MQLSKRLAAVAALVTTGCRLADVGTDHGYIPIALVQAGKIPHAIAMDINEGPLDRAKEHIRQQELESEIETRLSDGLNALKPGEADSVLIAGMGGLLVVRILNEGKERLSGCRELILQPQSDLRSVRAWLEAEGYVIAEENLVLEDGKYYPMMRAVSGKAEPMTELELRYGPRLLQQRHPLLDEYLKRDEMLALRVLESLDGKHTAAAVKRRFEIAEDLELLRSARALCRQPVGKEESEEV